MLEVKIFKGNELTEEIIEKFGQFSDDSYSQVMVIFVDGVPIQCESDMIEPEDCTFGRDLSWIPATIKLAYEQGIRDGTTGDNDD